MIPTVYLLGKGQRREGSFEKAEAAESALGAGGMAGPDVGEEGEKHDLARHSILESAA